MKLNSIIFKGSDHPKIQDAYQIRDVVFVQEQGFDKEPDIDKYDQICSHIIIYDNHTPVATARLIAKDDIAKIGRVAVIKNYRGRNIGKKIMEELINYAKEENFKVTVLSSQIHAQGFYESLGFVSKGDVYIEEGAPHIEMYKNL